MLEPLKKIPKEQEQHNLGREVSMVFAVQLLIIWSLVRVDITFGLGGVLHALVGMVFIFLPVFVLDRWGKPYARYGLYFANPLPELSWTVAAMLIAFVPIFFVAPYVWGVDGQTWSLNWPKGYPEIALAHLVIVALPEEFFYRGYLMGRLDDLWHKRTRLLGADVGWSLPVQAILFALGHFLIDFNPARLAVFFPALAFGWLKARRKNLVAPVLFHAASNIFMDIFRSGLGL